MYKICNLCQDEKLTKHFRKCRANPDGFSYACKQCLRKRDTRLYNRRGIDNTYQRSDAGRFAQLKTRAKIRKILVTITLEQYVRIHSSLCFYCSSPLPVKGYGIDRKNSSEGYTIENSVPCCGNCNAVKNDILTHKEMIVAMKAVLELRS